MSDSQATHINTIELTKLKINLLTPHHTTSPKLKTFRSPHSARFSRHSLLSGRTLSCYQSQEINIFVPQIRIEPTNIMTAP